MKQVWPDKNCSNFIEANKPLITRVFYCPIKLAK